MNTKYNIGQSFKVADDVDIILNGERVNNLNSITYVGHNQITLIGCGDYKEEYTVVIGSGYEKLITNTCVYGLIILTIIEIFSIPLISA